MTLPTGFTKSFPSPSIDSEVSTQPKKTTKETHPHLPPGLILDENGKVCKVCNSWADMSKVRKKKVTTGGNDQTTGEGGKKNVAMGGMAGFGTILSNSQTPSSSSSSSSQHTATPSTISTQVQEKELLNDRSNCPADNALLGRSTWTFLHTTAAYYPSKPNERQQIQMSNLLESLSLLYPCNWCSKDFQKDIKKNPPILDSRENLCKWLCERHNEVNLKLNKPTFKCETKELDERWKDGPEDGSCD